MNKAERSIHIMIPYGYPIPRETLLEYIERGMIWCGIFVEKCGIDFKLIPFPKEIDKGYYATSYIHENKIFGRELKADSFYHAQSMVEYPHEIVTGKIIAKFDELDDFDVRFDSAC